jgi:prevent-host-death family protein
MVTVGIRELKQHTSELVRLVREQHSPIQITYHGTVVAMLVPVEPPEQAEAEKQAWEKLDELAAQIGNRWPTGVSAAQAIAEDRNARYPR